MSAFALTDLDIRPELSSACLELFARCGPGRHHAVAGFPWRMGHRPAAIDLMQTLGTLVALEDQRPIGCLAICPYSDHQVTLWGPAIDPAYLRRGVGTFLMQETRRALAEGGYESLRVMVDERNRSARAFFRHLGLAAWKTDRIYERDLTTDTPEDGRFVALARGSDYGRISEILCQAFPDSSYCQTSLGRDKQNDYRHYILQESGIIIAAAAIRVGQPRAWLHLVAVDERHRGRHIGDRLLYGIMAQERLHGSTLIGLEVLEDNRQARALYERVGFRHAWSAAVMTGPV